MFMSKNTTATKNNYPIFSVDVAGALIDQGFAVVDRCRNYRDPRLWVYYFEDTPKFRTAFNQILNELKGNGSNK